MYNSNLEEDRAVKKNAKLACWHIWSLLEEIWFSNLKKKKKPIGLTSDGRDVRVRKGLHGI